MAGTLFGRRADARGGGRGLSPVWLAPLLVLALWTGEAKAQSTVLVSNVGETANASTILGTHDVAQKFTTGANGAGYSLTSIDVRLMYVSALGSGNAPPRVRVVSGAPGGAGSVTVATLSTGTSTVSDGVNRNYSYTAPQGTVLSASTDYWVVVEAAASGGGHVTFVATDSDGEDSSSAADWSIDNTSVNRASGSTGAFDGDFVNAHMIRIKGEARNNPATGAPTISGSAIVGQTLQANQGSIADDDGLPGSFAYQWIRVDGLTETDIAGATASTYQLQAADAGKTVKVRLSFTDDGGTSESRTSGAFPTTGTVQQPSQSSLAAAALVSNVGETWYSSSLVSGLDFAQKFTTGTNSDGYKLTSIELSLEQDTLQGSDNAVPRVRVVRGAATGAGSVTVATLTPPSPTIPLDTADEYTFTAPAGTVLSASTDYWVVVEAAASGGGDIYVSFTLSNAEDATPAAGWSIDDASLRRSHDSTGAFQTNSASMMIRINGEARTNTPATGAPTISGSAIVGQTLQAGQGSVADGDGLPGSFAYQWIRVDGLTETAIAGATARTYQLQAADAGKTVKVRLSFTDDGGIAESRTSGAFPTTGTVQQPSQSGLAGSVLVSNVGKSSSQSTALGTWDVAQRFTTGANSLGYSLASVEVRLSLVFGSDDAAPRVRLVSGAASGSSSVAVATLSAETSTIADTLGNYTYTAPEGTVLSASTDYWLVVEAAASGGGSVQFAVTTSDQEDSSSAAGWSIGNRAARRSHNSTGSFSEVDYAYMIRVKGSAIANTPATGAPTIAGSAIVGQTLEAGQGSIADGDGLPGSFAYQWIRVEGLTETAIAGATARTYQLQAADAGKTVKVRLSFTDNGGSPESRTSGAFPATGTVRQPSQDGLAGSVLVSNVGQTQVGSDTFASSDLAQKFTTGTSAHGYTLSGVELRLVAAGADRTPPSVRVIGGAPGGAGARTVATLTARTATVPGSAIRNIAYEAPAGTRLDRATDYWVAVEHTGGDAGFVSLGFTASDAEDAGAAAGWSIDDAALTRAAGSTGAFTARGNGVSYLIRIHGSDSAGANTPATGAPTIAGSAVVGQVLEAGQGSIADGDGLPGSFAYQWIRVDGLTETAIAGATANTYRLQAADAGRTVKVRLSFTDDGGSPESRTSGAFPATGTVRQPSQDGLAGAALVSNLGEIDNTGSTGLGGWDAAQKFTTGTHGEGYSLASVELRLTNISVVDSGNAAPRVRVVSGAAAGAGSVAVATLSAAAPTIALDTTDNYTFTAPEGTVLSASTDYWVVVEAAASGGSGVNVVFTASAAEDATPAAGWSIDDTRLIRGANSTGAFSAHNHPFMVRVKGSTITRTESVTDRPPRASNRSVRTVPDTGYTFTVDDFGYSDPDGDALASVKIETPPASGRGMLTLGDDPVAAGQAVARSAIDEGRLGYEPPAGMSGEDFAFFTFRVNDGTADSRDAYTMSVHVIEPGDERAVGAWISRFGRAAAGQVLEAVEGRMRAARQPAAAVSLAGQRVELAGLRAGPAPLSGEGAAPDEDAAPDFGGTRGMDGGALLRGLSFSLTGEAPGGGSASLWGRSALTRFDGREAGLAVEGEATGAMLGADWRQGRWTTGLVLAHSRGEGGYSEHGSGTARGTLEATLTGLYPWLRHELSDRLEAWGAAGYGKGTLTLGPQHGPALSADLASWMAAAGLRGTLLDPESAAGLRLTGKTDAMIADTSTAAADSEAGRLAAVETDVTRLRLGLELALPLMLREGALLTPGFELGARHDGGDAETGLGADVGASLAWTDAKSGLAAEFSARGLLAHKAGGFRERGVSAALLWQPGAGARGPRVSLAQSFGGASAGGSAALLERTTLEGLVRDDEGDELGRRRLEARLGYGFGAFGGRFTFTPEAGFGLSDTERDMSLGWRLARHLSGNALGSLELSFEARRRESANDNAPPAHEGRVNVTALF